MAAITIGDLVTQVSQLEKSTQDLLDAVSVRADQINAVVGVELSTAIKNCSLDKDSIAELSTNIEAIKSAYQNIQAIVDAKQNAIDAANASRLTVGTITTGDAGSQVAVTITGAAGSQKLNLTIPKGNNGASPYDLAVANGFTGTVQEWLSSLVAGGATIETGTWTPYFFNGDGVVCPPDFPIEYATYTRLGNIVHLEFASSFDIDATGCESTGINIWGLPFVPANSNGWAYGYAYNMAASGGFALIEGSRLTLRRSDKSKITYSEQYQNLVIVSIVFTTAYGV